MNEKKIEYYEVEKMIYKLRSGEAAVRELILEAALVGIQFWRSGDVKEARHIIGTIAYEQVIQRVGPQRVGELFLMAVVAGDLPLVCRGKNSAKYYVYALEGDVPTPVAKPATGCARHLRVPV
uniref:hypothetical protein n=1 Tax=Marinobacterium profundum TaxID=1714300 RepID=UPI0013156E8B|nr:hypothetical protein [Marinobacterium profundum]